MVSHEKCGWLKCQGYEQKHYRQGLQILVDCKPLSCLRRSSHCLTPSAGACCGSGAVKAWNPSQSALSSSIQAHIWKNSWGLDCILSFTCSWQICLISANEHKSYRRWEEEGKNHIANSISEKLSKNNSNSALWFEMSTPKTDKDRSLSGFSKSSLV